MESKQGTSVLFPNLKYEIENNYISELGLNYITDLSLDKNLIELKELYHHEIPNHEHDNDKINCNCKFNITISEFQNIQLFSLWTINKIKDVFFYPNYNHNLNPDILVNISNPELFPSMNINSLISNIEDLKNVVKVKMNNPMEVSPYINSKFFWATKFDAVDKKCNNITDIIVNLGLTEYCSVENWNQILYGFKLCVNDIIYKPNITNEPFKDAYCCLKHESNENWGVTFNLLKLEPALPESVLPFLYFEENKIQVVDIIKYDHIQNIPIDKNNVIAKINELLLYDKNITYNFLIDQDSGKAKIKFLKI
ncbi:MAG: hypothetical protein IPI90_06760 [Saprospiraceae bacterium]|nr:hypothetical protein [Candidatus Vicinibacter affinis]